MITCQIAISIHFSLVRICNFGWVSKFKSGPKSHFRSKSITWEWNPSNTGPKSQTLDQNLNPGPKSSFSDQNLNPRVAVIWMTHSNFLVERNWLNFECFLPVTRWIYTWCITPIYKWVLHYITVALSRACQMIYTWIWWKWLKYFQKS